MKIKEVIVVEGEHDATRLKQLYDVDVIVTNGSAISKETINLIKQAAKTRGIIVFTDPDYPGERIRKIITENVPNAKHAFVRKKDAIDTIKKKVGVEHCTNDCLKEALSEVKEFKEQKTIPYDKYVDLGFVGNAKKRADLCNKLNIGKCNAKTLYKRLNMIGISVSELERLINDEK